METEARLVRRVQRLVALQWLILAEPDTHTRKALAARFGVSERQITKDLAVLDQALDTAIIHTKRGYRFDRALLDRVRPLVLGADDPHLNASEAAAIAGRTTTGIIAAITSGRLIADRHPKNPHTWRITRADLDVFLATPKRTRGPRAKPPAPAVGEE